MSQFLVDAYWVTWQDLTNHKAAKTLLGQNRIRKKFENVGECFLLLRLRSKRNLEPRWEHRCTFTFTRQSTLANSCSHCPKIKPIRSHDKPPTFEVNSTRINKNLHLKYAFTNSKTLLVRKKLETSSICHQHPPVTTFTQVTLYLTTWVCKLTLRSSFY